tara:strand:- start:159 stop:668 length:510 start_codon:yes stop_codon:yes gene_type:complete
MKFIEDNEMNTITFNEKALMTIIEQSHTDYDHKTNELQDDNDKLKEKLVGYDHLLRAEGGVTIEKVIDIKKEWMGHKKEIRRLKKENQELEETKEELEETKEELEEKDKENIELQEELEEKDNELEEKDNELKKLSLQKIALKRVINLIKDEIEGLRNTPVLYAEFINP